MKITVNGKPMELEAGTVRVLDVLNACKVEMPDTVSVQLNGTFVPRERFGSASVNDGDEVDFLYFMGGGGR